MDYNVYKGDVLFVKKVHAANNFFTRFKGLMFRRSMPEDCGLLIDPCNQVHTFNMRFPIDVLFLSKDYEVMYIEHSMKAWKVSKMVSKGKYVLELNAGLSKKYGVDVGDKLTFKKL